MVRQYDQTKSDIKKPLPAMGHNTTQEHVPPREAEYDVYKKPGERIFRPPGESLIHPVSELTSLPENVGRRKPLNSGMTLNFHDKPIKSKQAEVCGDWKENRRCCV